MSSEKEWRCFFCGEVFTDEVCASNHFGRDLLSLAACEVKASELGLLGTLRDQEYQLMHYRQEDSDTDRRMASMVYEHSSALRRAEEAGYVKGMNDLLELPEDELETLRKDRRGGPGSALGEEASAAPPKNERTRTEGMA